MNGYNEINKCVCNISKRYEITGPVKKNNVKNAVKRPKSVLNPGGVRSGRKRWYPRYQMKSSKK